MVSSSPHLIEQQSLKDIKEVAEHHKIHKPTSYRVIHQQMLHDALTHKRWDVVEYFLSENIPRLSYAFYNYWCTHFPPELNELIPLAQKTNRMVELFLAVANPSNPEVQPYCKELLPFIEVTDQEEILNKKIEHIPCFALQHFLNDQVYDQEKYMYWTENALLHHQFEHANLLIQRLDRPSTASLLDRYQGRTGIEEELHTHLQNLALHEKHQLGEHTPQVQPRSTGFRL